MFKFSINSDEIICFKGWILLTKLPFLESKKYTIKLKNKVFFEFDLQNQICDFGSVINVQVIYGSKKVYKCNECKKGLLNKKLKKQ